MRSILVLAAVGVLAGCQLAIPDFRPGSVGGSSTTTGPSADGFTGGGATAGEAARAEQACRAAAINGGLAVNGIADNREVRDAGGFPIARDVMLNVTRGGQNFTVRCSYAMASDDARLMVL